MIEVDLMPVLFQEAKAAGLGVGADCEGEVRRFIVPADKVYRGSTPAARAQIQQTFTRFVQAMVAEAKDRHLTELREITFHSAKSRLCPLFPFC